MANDRNNDLTKITVRLFAPMYASFDAQLSDLMLRRDAFIDRMIANEIPHLRHDLEGKKLSPKAKRYISQSLNRMGKHPLEKKCISVLHSTAAALAEAVEMHNLERDAFINWLIALLRSSDTLLARLDLPTHVSGIRGVSTEDMATSPLKAICQIQLDPLYYLRAACEHRHGCGLYSLELPTGLHGLACYLPDEDVPGTPERTEKIKREKHSNALLTELEDFESNLITIASKPI